MKKSICILLAFVLVLSLAACGGGKASEWTREGTFKDENGNLLSISKSEDSEYPGWYVGAMIDEGMYGWYIKQEGKDLHGNIVSEYMEEEPFIVTVSEEGEDGVLLKLESGKEYHFSPYEIPEAAIVVTINVKGMGEIAYAKEGGDPVFDDEYPYQSAYLGLEGPETYTVDARPGDGYKFWKWTGNGEDLSYEHLITLEFNEDTELVAVFGIAGSDETYVDLESVKTLGEVLGLPVYGSSIGAEKGVFIVEQDWEFYRVEAKSSQEVLDAVLALDYEDPEYGAKEKAILANMEILSIENISEEMLSPAQMKALAGKTGEELLSEGWTVDGGGYEGEYLMTFGYFEYTVKFETEAESGSGDMEEDIKALTVKSVSLEGIASSATDY